MDVATAQSPFAVLTFGGALVWCSALTALGYAVGANYTRVSGAIGAVAIVIAVLIVLGLAAWYIRGRRARVVAAGAPPGQHPD